MATMYFLDVNTAIESVSAMWGTFSNNMPTDVIITPERTGDTIEDTTGAITGSWVGGVVTAHQGANAGAYAAPAGAVVTWLTSTVLDRHRLHGRTFIVPCGNGAFTAGGGLTGGAQASFQAAATQFVLEQNASAVVWHRPFKGTPATATKPARPPHIGGHGLFTGSRVPPLAAILKSRRD